MSENSRLGVVGAGTMGAGIAQLGCEAGWETYLHDPLTDVESAIEAIQQRWKRKCRSFPPPRRVGDLARLAACDVIVEAVPEHLELKRELFGRLGEVAPAAVLCSNTSSIPITRIASATQDPSRVVGMHFFNPAPVMRLVEVIPAMQSSAEAVERVVKLGGAMGKDVIVCADVAGFVVNRTNRPFSIEPVRCLAEQIADIETIDKIFRVGGGFRMGPFEFQDLVGIDVSDAVGRSFHEASFGEERWRPSPLLGRMIDAGWLGLKSGRGWYGYSQGDECPATGEAPTIGNGKFRVEGEGPIAAALREIGGEQGPVVKVDALGGSVDGEPFYAVVPLRLVEVTGEAGERAFASADLPTARVRRSPGGVLPRAVCQLVNEAHFTLGEGIAKAEDIDHGMTLGLNHPRGPFAWSEMLGLDNVCLTLARLRNLHGDAYRPAPLLQASATSASVA